VHGLAAGPRAERDGVPYLQLHHAQQSSAGLAVVNDDDEEDEKMLRTLAAFGESIM
jgi:hypothetical protein